MPKTAPSSSTIQIVPSLLEELERELKKIIRQYDIIAATVCDREGAFLCKVLNDSKADGLFQQSMLNQKLMSSSENLIKMDLGSPSKLLLQFDRYQILKFFNPKFIIAFVASYQVPTGTLFSFEPDCDAIFQLLCNYFE
ncbi:hypothetical protein SSS_05352 [Sarcoptes scabiei]|uniref:Uncharacterized protein n=1 Tax=Sarcoptes scabiei TaxID=52283 RepID=A0A834RCK1_SARSC|nr:hypothetical protein SSS_05352 [Sarcoptes scabiei]